MFILNEYLTPEFTSVSCSRPSPVTFVPADVDWLQMNTSNSSLHATKYMQLFYIKYNKIKSPHPKPSVRLQARYEQPLKLYWNLTNETAYFVPFLLFVYQEISGDFFFHIPQLIYKSYILSKQKNVGETRKNDLSIYLGGFSKLLGHKETRMSALSTSASIWTEFKYISIQLLFETLHGICNFIFFFP